MTDEGGATGEGGATNEGGATGEGGATDEGGATGKGRATDEGGAYATKVCRGSPICRCYSPHIIKVLT